MTNSKPTVDSEFAAIQTLYMTLEPLDTDARSRIVNYVVDRLEIVLQSMPESESIHSICDTSSEKLSTNKEAVIKTFGTFAELFDAAQPKTNSDKALIVGYWIQVCQSADNFTGQMANSELKNLGYGLSNVTDSISSLSKRKPTLIIQIKKSGTSKQARKVYKVTDAGIKAVGSMIHE